MSKAGTGQPTSAMSTRIGSSDNTLIGSSSSAANSHEYTCDRSGLFCSTATVCTQYDVRHDLNVDDASSFVINMSFTINDDNKGCSP